MVKKTTLQVVSLGCSKNLVDSEKILGQLPSERFSVIEEGREDPNIVIVNTCGFIHDAKEESIDTILQIIEKKKKGLHEKVLVCGCLSQRYLDDLRQEIPEVDAWFGVSAANDLYAYLKETYQNDLPQRYITTPKHYAYLKIAEGCDRTCSFCAIPMIRGAYQSATIDSLTEEATILAGKGVKELLLVAQDLSYYGYDLSKKPMLAKLLQSLIRVEGIEWIRLHYAYPNNFPEDVLQLMAENPRICNYLDIPLQHINDELLLSMRRGHSKKQTIRFLEKVRRLVPGIALRTTLMVGYPGETKQAFQELYDFVEAVRFDRLGVFTYSPEEGTRAFNLGDPIAQAEKNRREEAIMSLQASISLQINQAKVGKTYRVLIDRVDGKYLVGRTEFDSPEVDNEVLIPDQKEIIPGQFIDVLITKADEYDLYGKPLD